MTRFFAITIISTYVHGQNMIKMMNTYVDISNLVRTTRFLL